MASQLSLDWSENKKLVLWWLWLMLFFMRLLWLFVVVFLAVIVVLVIEVEAVLVACARCHPAEVVRMCGSFLVLFV